MTGTTSRKRLAGVLTFASAMVVSVCSAQAQPPLLPNDHLSGYRVTATTPFPPGVTRTPVDEFGDHGVCTIGKEAFLYTPSDKGEEVAANPSLHYVGYRVRCPNRTRRDELYADQFSAPGSYLVGVRNLRSILVPSGKSVSPDPDPAAPAPVTNHYLCYKTRGIVRFRSVETTDQFGERRLVFGKLTAVCNPADKDGDDPSAPTDPDHYICYKARVESGPDSGPTVRTNNLNFGLNTLKPRQLTEFCVPAARGGQPTTTTTTTTTTLQICGDGNVTGSEECDPPASQAGDPLCNDDCSLSTCGDGTIEAGEQCEVDADCSGGQACSSCCACMDGTCPDRMQWTMHAGTGALSTATELDYGWTGIAHDRDHLDASDLTLQLCSATGSGPAACGDASVRGVTADTCRCQNDNRTACDEPFQADQDDCAGNLCVCYARPPEPSSQGNVPTCDLWRLASPPTGTWNVDTGAGSVAMPMRQIRFLGEAVVMPCPTCDGDATANDGLRDGTCNAGRNDGSSCDANASDATFPAPGGGQYSYDCFPAVGKNVSGAGARLAVEMTTGTAALPPAAIECGNPPLTSLLCPCAVCDNDVQMPCTSNADCTGAGACAMVAPFRPSSNDCDNFDCDDDGGGEGVCATGPIDQFCDAVVRANGEGFINCASNADCAVENIGIAAGNCALSKTRECFLDPITATGAASASDPLLVAAYCSAQTGSAGHNATMGLPGPLREKLQVSATLYCAGTPAATSSGCP